MYIYKGLIALIGLALLNSGCASSKIVAFKDPAYESATFQKVGVFAVGMTLDAGLKLENEVCAKITPAPCEAGKALLPPTRPYMDEEIKSVLENRGVDSILVITLASDQSSTQYLGSTTSTSGSATTTANTYGTAYAYGNRASYSGTTAGSTTYSGTSTTTPIYRVSRATFGDILLLDAASGTVAWRGQIRTFGSGLLSVTDDAFISSATREIATQLRDTGFFPILNNLH